MRKIGGNDEQPPPLPKWHIAILILLSQFQFETAYAAPAELGRAAKGAVSNGKYCYEVD